MKKIVFKENKLGNGYLTPIYPKFRINRHLKGGRTQFGSYCEEDYKCDKPPKNKLF